MEPGDAIKHCKERIPDTRVPPRSPSSFCRGIKGADISQASSVTQIAKTKRTLYESVQVIRDDTVVMIDDTMIRADDHNNDYGHMNLMMQR